ncbi:MAG TPA: hypothetical protein VN541_08355 [Tepidisphaeraceae bacterium]|nr:hypothetical protein [Tepidisphaeraceae bacterium]
MPFFRTSTLAACWILAVGWCLAQPCFAQTKPEAQTQLKLVSPIAAQYDDGPPLGGMRLRPGEVVYFSFIVEGYARSAERKVDITGHIQVFDPRGIPVAPADEIPILTTLSEEDKEWKPKVRSAITLPPIAPHGTYKIRYDATDNQSHQAVAAEASFDVEAKLVAPAPALTIRELNFFRRQEDTTPLITPVYRAGDMIWVKFYIVGYKTGEQNSIDSSYDVELLGPDGASIMKKEDAAMEKSTAYYPQPYIPGIFNLTLKSTTPPAAYTVVITAHDNVGSQTATAQSKYQVH